MCSGAPRSVRWARAHARRPAGSAAAASRRAGSAAGRRNVSQPARFAACSVRRTCSRPSRTIRAPSCSPLSRIESVALRGASRSAFASSLADERHAVAPRRRRSPKAPSMRARRIPRGGRHREPRVLDLAADRGQLHDPVVDLHADPREHDQQQDDDEVADGGPGGPIRRRGIETHARTSYPKDAGRARRPSLSLVVPRPSCPALTGVVPA